MSGIIAAAGISLAGTVFSALSGNRRAKKQRRAAQRRIKQLEAQGKALRESRPDIIDPYSGITNLSDMAKDLSGMITNPYANLGVATKAMEVQIEQTDIALANTLDTLRATGSSAGGATALAQAALQSKNNVAANLEQQEAQNQKLKAQGEANSQARIMAEKQRIQGVEMSEAQRVQQAEVAGKQFVFGAEENRVMTDLNHTYSQMGAQQQNVANSYAAQGQAMSGMMQGIANIGGSLIASGAFGGNQASTPLPGTNLSQPVSTLTPAGVNMSNPGATITAPPIKLP